MCFWSLRWRVRMYFCLWICLSVCVAMMSCRVKRTIPGASLPHPSWWVQEKLFVCVWTRLCDLFRILSGIFTNLLKQDGRYSYSTPWFNVSRNTNAFYMCEHEPCSVNVCWTAASKQTSHKPILLSLEPFPWRYPIITAVCDAHWLWRPPTAVELEPAG